MYFHVVAEVHRGEVLLFLWHFTDKQSFVGRSHQDVSCRSDEYSPDFFAEPLGVSSHVIQVMYEMPFSMGVGHAVDASSECRYPQAALLVFLNVIYIVVTQRIGIVVVVLIVCYPVTSVCLFVQPV